MEGLPYISSDVHVTAGFTLSETESAALGGAFGASSPTDGTVTLSSLAALWVAESSALFKSFRALEGVAVAAGVVLLGA
jgi:hypothetical protein